ncbi:MAG: putative metal-binding motif-containing protein [Polyangiaceae bacterium]
MSRTTLFFFAMALSACGSRSGLYIPNPPPYEPDPGDVECFETDDCPGKKDPCGPQRCLSGKCVAQPGLVCADDDPCTNDRCDSTVGACVFEPVTLDLDGDGHRAPRPGTKPGDPDSCGDDCDDTSALAFPGPGSIELCDGNDNDCNGIIDDNSVYVLSNDDPTRVSENSLTHASASGIAFASETLGYIATYAGESSSGDTDVYAHHLDGLGNPAASSSTINATSGDASGGAIVWTGDRYGVAWQDRRSGNYEIYFNTLGPDGAKLGPDVQLTQSDDFSINPTIAWNGNDFYVAYEDRRSGEFMVYGRRIDLEGKNPGEERLLAGGFDPSESPAIAADSTTVAIAYYSGTPFSSSIKVKTFNPDLSPISDEISLGGGDVGPPSISRNGPDYAVVWGEKTPFAIFGAVVSRDGSFVAERTQLSEDGGFNRYPTVTGLGDRIAVAYAREEDAPNADYNIYFRTFSKTLTPLGNAVPIVARVGLDRPTMTTLGPQGDIAVLFEGDVASPEGTQRAVFFSRMTCSAQ